MTGARALQRASVYVAHLQWSARGLGTVRASGTGCKVLPRAISHCRVAVRLHGLLAGARVSTADSPASGSSQQWCYSSLGGMGGVQASLTLGGVAMDDLTDLCACRAECTGAGAHLADLGLKLDLGWFSRCEIGGR